MLKGKKSSLITVGRVGAEGEGVGKVGGGGGYKDMSSKGQSCRDRLWINTDNTLMSQENLESLVTVGSLQGLRGGGGRLVGYVNNT